MKRRRGFQVDHRGTHCPQLAVPLLGRHIGQTERARSRGPGQGKPDIRPPWGPRFGSLPRSKGQLSFPALAFVPRYLLAGVLVFSLLGVSCSEDPSTQVVVLMDTDYEVPSEVDRIHAHVSKIVDKEGGGSEEVPTWENIFNVSNEMPSEPGAYALPATFGILPDGSDIDREIVIELEALAPGNDEPLVSRRVKTGFVPGEARLVEILLYRACAGVQCPVGQTCGCTGDKGCAAPSCIDETVLPEDMQPISDPGVLPPNPGIPDGGGLACSEPLVVCGDECVNTEADPRYCGDCETECQSGYVCEAGVCTDPGDCTTSDVECTGLTYCDEETGDCLPGCIDDEQCIGGNEVCDKDENECVCDADFERCEGVCVDTQIDPLYCGDCETVCTTGWVCEAGECLDPGDCRTNEDGCSGLTYCNEETGECLPGCAEDEQCTEENEVCDTVANECTCAPGYHQCGGICASDLDVNTCGELCTPCPAPPNSTAICDVGVCDFVCDATFERCDDACCPTSCPPGEVLYEDTCASTHLRVVAEDGNVGQYSSLALDAANGPHMAHHAPTGRNLMYAAPLGEAVWASETPDAAGDVGRYASLAFDRAGVAHIAYYDATDDDLKYASRQGAGSWSVEIVDDVDDVGQHASLAFDAAGVAHISYYDRTNKNLMYATQLSAGVWSIQIVDDEREAGQYTSLAFDRFGVAHISYYDESDKDLRLATQASDGSWVTRVVASQGDVGKYSSLAFDATGAAHISFYDESNEELLYTTEFIFGFWETQTVDDQGDVGTHTSLALDQSGRARISYYDGSRRDLKYAAQLGSRSWAVQSVDTAGSVGRYTSIDVDNQGNAHISYYDATNDDLKYALIAAPN